MVHFDDPTIEQTRVQKNEKKKFTQILTKLN